MKAKKSKGVAILSNALRAMTAGRLNAARAVDALNKTAHMTWPEGQAAWAERVRRTLRAYIDIITGSDVTCVAVEPGSGAVASASVRRTAK